MHLNVSQKTFKKVSLFYKMNLSGKKQENRANNEAVVKEMLKVEVMRNKKENC